MIVDRRRLAIIVNRALVPEIEKRTTRIGCLVYAGRRALRPGGHVDGSDSKTSWLLVGQKGEPKNEGGMWTLGLSS